MKKRIVILLTVTAMLLTVLSAGFSGFAVYEEGIIYGDIDGDKVVSTADARLALQVAAGLKSIADEDVFNRADINFDGAITIFDARQILRCATGLVSLQPTGSFSGFDGGGIFKTEEDVVIVFNYALNRIKTEDNGYAASLVKTESDQLTAFSIEEIELVGINFGTGADAVAKMVKDIIVSDDEQNTVTAIAQGSQNYTLMSIEGSPYVSKLTAGDLYGVKASLDNEKGYITISVALPDTEIEAVTQSSYSKAFNTEMMLEESDSIIVKLLGSNSVDSAMRREYKNCVLTVVIDTANLDVVSYDASYESHVYIAEASMKTGVFTSSLAKMKNVTFAKTHSIKYEDFQWAVQ